MQALTLKLSGNKLQLHIGLGENGKGKPSMSSGRQTPTLQDVARHAGVSTATVSRCLNSPDRVIESTRLRVLQAVQTLGYSPHFAARAMAAKRTKTIGAIIPTMENAIFARGLQAFQEELRENGYTLLVASSSYRPDIEQQQIKSLVARGADGLLLIGRDRDPSIYEFLETQNVPALVAWSFDEQTHPPSVGFDNRKAMRELAERVLELGHRRIGVISAPTAENDRARHRILGIEDAVAAAGLESGAIRVIETPYGIDTGAEALQRLLSTSHDPTVIMCGNDVLAVGAMKKAHELNLKVPEDLSITGFDDIELATVTTPALTTVHVPHREMGCTAAKNLIAMVEQNNPTRNVELATTIRLRASLAQPKS